MLASLDEAERAAFLEGLSENALGALPWLWEVWAHPGHQLEPKGDWHTWVILGGRAAGKTRAGAEWIRAELEGATPDALGRARRVALVGETIDQVRAVMVEGESGLMAVTPPDRRPDFLASRNRLVWPNGAEAMLLSAANPEAIRGPQFDCAWADELACPKVDLEANQPNLFSDAKSSESALPYGSLGVRDDEMQRRFLQARLGYWSDELNMPVSSVTCQPMIPQDRIFVWTWDSRPWPDFPVRTSVWVDGPAHRLGHWITGRVSASGLAEVVAEICRRAGLTDFDVSGLHGVVDGYVIERNESAREALQPLMLAFGFDAFESGGKVVFRMRGEPAVRRLPESDLAAPEDGASSTLERVRAPRGTAPDVVRLSYVQAESDFRVGASEARFPGPGTVRLMESSLPLALPGSKAQQIADRWLAESSRARDSAFFKVAPSEMALEPGDAIEIDRSGTIETYKLERIVHTGAREIEAVRIEANQHVPSVAPERNLETVLASPPGPVSAIFLDLPLATGGLGDHQPRIAVSADPWTDRVAIYRSDDDSAYALIATLAKPAVIGTTLDPLEPGEPNRWQRVSVRVATQTGSLESSERFRVLNGANLAALEYAPDEWEIVQFRDAVLLAPGEYRLSTLLRGLRGTGALSTEEIATGARFVLLDDAVVQLPMHRDERGLPRHYRVGPARYALSHPSYGHSVEAFAGVGLRPFAPVRLEARRDRATTDLVLGWIRAARFGADSWEGTDVPLAEEREAYRVRILKAGNLLREVEVTEPGFIYTAAMQAADAASAPPGASGAWAGQDGKLAVYLNGGWDFIAPWAGWRLWVASESGFAGYDGIDWHLIGQPVTQSGAMTVMRHAEIDHAIASGPTSETSAFIPDKAVVLGVTARVISAIGGAGAWSLGVSGSVDRYGSGIGIGLNAYLSGVTGSPIAYYGVASLLLTAEGGDFTGGTVRIAAHYFEVSPPRPV